MRIVFKSFRYFVSFATRFHKCEVDSIRQVPTVSYPYYSWFHLLKRAILALRRCFSFYRKFFLPESLSFLFVCLFVFCSEVAKLVKNPPAMREIWVQSLGWEDPLVEGKATCTSNILAWRIPWTIESMGSQRIGYD